MIRTSTLLKLAHIILDMEHQSDFGAEPEEIIDAIDNFFETDPDVIASGNKGKGENYYEAIQEMFQHVAESLHETLRL